MTEEVGVSQFVPFKARMRGDRPRVQLEVEVLYDLDGAAAALAIELPEMPRQFGVKSVPRILGQAARKGTSGRALGKAGADMKGVYRKKLVDLGVFEDGEAGGKRKGERPKGRVATRMPDGRERMVIKVPVLYDLDEAAAALAIQLPQMSWRFGKRTIQATLHDAAVQNVTGRALEKANPDMSAIYREALLDLGIFEAQP